jgi:hypothetical protein
MSFVISKLKYLRDKFFAPIYGRLEKLEVNSDYVLQSLGRIEKRQLENRIGLTINDHEFQVFSQWGEDGIIQYLIKSISISRPIFVEFGIEDYKQANTKFLLVNNNWSGFVIDNNENMVNRLRADRIYWLFNIKAVIEFITRENINRILEQNGIVGEIGLLSIDLDGNDYWIWDSINIIQPDIVVVEYNYRFGKDLAVTIPYNENFDRGIAHFSKVYYGASLRALCLLGMKKGYAFVGCCSNGVNAFFIKKEKRPSHIPALSVDEGYFDGKFSDSYNTFGELVKSSPEEEKSLLSSFDFPLVDVENLIDHIKNE